MKVYLSSTFADLREHRAAVDLALRRMGHDVIGMEQYVAEAMTPLARSTGDVVSADVYVVLVAWRYGYRPVDPVVNPDEYSITELEFRAACGAGVPVLAFLLDPDTPWPPSRSDAFAADGWARVRDFRSLLGSAFLAGIFTSPDDLASQVMAAVAARGVNSQMVDRALTQQDVTGVMEPFGRGDDLVDTTLLTITAMIGGAGHTRTFLVPLGTGDAWWSTRLYLLAVLAQQLTGVRQLLFSRSDGSFAAMASPDAVRAGLSAAFRELAEFDSILRSGPASRDVQRELERCLTLWRQQVGVREREIKVGVRTPLLVEWLGERLITRSVEVDVENGITMVQVQQLVDSLIRDVPVQRTTLAHTYELMVVDRDAFALELAREWVRTGLPRVPVR